MTTTTDRLAELAHQASMEITNEKNVLLNRHTTAILVVDMLNDFCHKDGSLFVPNSIATIEPIRKLCQRASAREEVKCFFLEDNHHPMSQEFENWPQHALHGTWGANTIDELKSLKGGEYLNLTFWKTRFDGFFGTPLDTELTTNSITNVIIVGTVSNICVLATAASAAMRWYNVIIPEDCISALDEVGQFITLSQISNLYKGTITTSEEIDFTSFESE